MPSVRPPDPVSERIAGGRAHVLPSSCDTIRAPECMAAADPFKLDRERQLLGANRPFPTPANFTIIRPRFPVAESRTIPRKTAARGRLGREIISCVIRAKLANFAGSPVHAFTVGYEA